MSRFRHFCMTCFETGDTLKEQFEENKQILRYFIAGEEICPKTNKTHYQCYMYLKNTMSLKKIIEKWRPNHIEICKGDSESNIKYCKKEEKIFIEYGEPPSQGKRTDILKAIELAKNQTNDQELINTCPTEFLKYHRGLEKIKTAFNIKRNWKMEVIIIWSQYSGNGKSRYVWDTEGIDNVYVKPKNKWWDHYNGEETVLIDDFAPNEYEEGKFTWWLTLLDRYPMIIEYKGGSCHFRSKKIYITSNHDPDTWFIGILNRHAFFRRVSKIYWVDKNGEFHDNNLEELQKNE